MIAGRPSGGAPGYRRADSPLVADFLTDGDPRIATEAARAIHDVPILDALPKLAALLDKGKQPEFLLWRALNANLPPRQVGERVALAHFAANADAPEKLRAEAVKMLGLWANPGRRDRVTGLTQDLGQRDGTIAAAALKDSLGGIFSGPNAVRGEAAKVAATLGIKEVGPALFDLASDTKRPAVVRVETLRALATLKDARSTRRPNGAGRYRSADSCRGTPIAGEDQTGGGHRRN